MHGRIAVQRHQAAAASRRRHTTAADAARVTRASGCERLRPGEAAVARIAPRRPRRGSEPRSFTARGIDGHEAGRGVGRTRRSRARMARRRRKRPVRTRRHTPPVSRRIVAATGREQIHGRVIVYLHTRGPVGRRRSLHSVLPLHLHHLAHCERGRTALALPPRGHSNAVSSRLPFRPGCSAREG